MIPRWLPPGLVVLVTLAAFLALLPLGNTQSLQGMPLRRRWPAVTAAALVSARDAR